MRLPVCFALATLLALPAAAQAVLLTGRVERAPATPCNAAATHKIACTDILLRSTVLDLTALEGRMVDLTGTSEGSLPCPLVNVSAAVAAAQSTATFSLGGYRINSTVLFTTTAPAGAFVGYFFSSEPGFLPLLDLGTLQLNPLTDFTYWTFDVSIGVALRTVRLPDDPGLVGLRVLFQTGFASITPSLQFKLLNAACFTIR